MTRNLCSGIAEHERAHDQAVDVRVLRRYPQRQLIGRPRVGGDRGARLDGDGDEPLVHEPLPNDRCRPGERRIGRGRVADLPAKADVVGAVIAHDGRALSERLLDVGHCWERVVVHDHQLGRVARGVWRVGDDHRDSLAHVVHPLDGNREMVARLQSRQEPAYRDAVHAAVREVLARVNRDHARSRARGAQVDAADARVCMRTPNERGVDGPHQSDVVRVEPAPSQESRVFLAPYARTKRTLERARRTCVHAALDADSVDARGGGRCRGHGRPPQRVLLPGTEISAPVGDERMPPGSDSGGMTSPGTSAGISVVWAICQTTACTARTMLW